MKGTDVRCPICGTVNRSLFLEETEGNYECEGCGYCGTIEGYGKLIHQSGTLRMDTSGTAVKKERLTPLMA